MQFIYPLFLWALLALAIPIIIHLFAFRRFKKVAFTNVRFLQEIKEETSNRSKLKNLLTLLMRLLAVACLVFAFAQPFLPTGADVKTGSNAVSVFVDNSYSMLAQQDETPLLEVAKAKARAIIEAYGESDKFQVLTHDFEGRHQRLVTKEDAVLLVDAISASPTVRSFAQIYNRQKQTTDLAGDNTILYILSDFQRSILPATKEDAYSLISDTITEINLVPIQSIIEKNISIDSAWLESPVPLLNQVNRLFVKITNHSEQDVDDVALSIVKDDQTKPEGTRSIRARSSIIDTININLLKPGSQKVMLKINDYPIQFDDTYYITVDVPEKITALAINESQPNRYLDAVFRGLKYYHLDNQSTASLKYADFNTYDLIILNDINTMSTGLSTELSDYVLSGGNVLVFPGINAINNGVNAFLRSMATNTLEGWSTDKKQSSRINTDEFVFKDVFAKVGSNLKLPTTTGQYSLTDYQSRGERKILRYRDGSSYFVKYDKGAGSLYLCASPLHTDYNDLVLNAEIFVPMLYKAALSKRNTTKPAYTIGSSTPIELNSTSSGTDILYKIQGDVAFIPGQSTVRDRVLLDVNDQIRTAGAYSLLLGEQSLRLLAFNYDRRESDVSIDNADDLRDLFGTSVSVIESTKGTNFTQLIGEKDKGIQLWRWFLVGCLGFLGIESLLLRFLKSTV